MHVSGSEFAVSLFKVEEKLIPDEAGNRRNIGIKIRQFVFPFIFKRQEYDVLRQDNTLSPNTLYLLM